MKSKRLHVATVDGAYVEIEGEKILLIKEPKLDRSTAETTFMFAMTTLIGQYAIIREKSDGTIEFAGPSSCVGKLRSLKTVNCVYEKIPICEDNFDFEAFKADKASNQS